MNRFLGDYAVVNSPVSGKLPDKDAKVGALIEDPKNEVLFIDAELLNPKDNTLED